MCFETILTEIQAIVADVLAIEPIEVEPSSRFFEDLGGESLDALELGFQCKKKFGVDLRFQDILASDELTTNEQGVLTVQAIEGLKARYPYLNYQDFERHAQMNRMTELLTVEAIAKTVHAAITNP